jgi:beta-glucosidase
MFVRTSRCQVVARSAATWCLLVCGSLGPVVSPARAETSPPAIKSFDPQADAVLAKMTLAEKVGQMTQAELTELDDLGEIASLSLGSVLSGGDSDPKAGNGVKAWTDAIEACQKAAVKSRLKIPILYGVDAVHGHSNVEGAVIFPHNVALGCTRDAALVEEIGRITALEARATSANWAFAPCVTVPQDDRWGRTYEGFSEDPSVCGELGAAAVRGMQGTSLADAQRVLACAKHYAGDGGTVAEVRRDAFHENQVRLALDQGDVRCDEATFRRIHLAPYPPCVAAGVGSIMPSYSSWNGVKCSIHKQLMTDVLKGEMGFEGFLISDFNALDQVAPDFREAVKLSINAGMDMVMVPSKYREFIKHLTSLAESGEVPMSRIDDAVRRILRVKAAMGLLDPAFNPEADRSLHAQVGCEAHRRTAREAVRKSLVLLKNAGGALPLSKSEGRILVSGVGADDMGMQCGGWTIAWQGKMGAIPTGGKTILAGLRELGGAERVLHSADGAGCQAADVNVVVVGETPYAEGKGDSDALALSDADHALVKRVAAAGKPLVVVVLSGRPVILADVLEEADAVVAAWLPGSEGQGVADVLFGEAPPVGKLSFTWPTSVADEPLNAGDGKPGALFPLGFGLSYQ